MVISYEDNQYKILLSNQRAENMVSMQTDEGNLQHILERPIFKLITNETAEEMGLNGDNQETCDDKVLKSLRFLLEDRLTAMQDKIARIVTTGETIDDE